MNAATRQRRMIAAPSAVRMTSAGMNGMSPIAEPTYEASLRVGRAMRGEPVVHRLVASARWRGPAGGRRRAGTRGRSRRRQQSVAGEHARQKTRIGERSREAPARAARRRCPGGSSTVAARSPRSHRVRGTGVVAPRLARGARRGGGDAERFMRRVSPDRRSGETFRRPTVAHPRRHPRCRSSSSSSSPSPPGS